MAEVRQAESAISEWLASYHESLDKSRPRRAKTLSLVQAYGQLSFVNEMERQAQDLLPRPRLAHQLFMDARWRRGEGNYSAEYDNSRQDALRDTIRALRQRQAELRSRVDALSRSLTRPLTILDLPQEVLHMVLKYVQGEVKLDSKSVEKRVTRWKDPQKHLQDLRSCRLVCRAFNELASPYLTPVILLSVDQDSLDRLMQISKAPHIATGVQAVAVNLACYAKELADDINLFGAHLSCLMRMFRHWGTSCNYLPGGTFDEKTDAPESPVDVEAADLVWYMKLVKHAPRWDLKTLESSWDRDYENSNPSTPIYRWDCETDQAWRVLTRAHGRYARQYRQQTALIETGVFAREAAQALARLPKLCRVNFFDAEPEWRDCWGKQQHHDPYRLLASHHDWASLQYLGRRVCREKQLDWKNLLPVTVLCDLPIAIKEAGTCISELELVCLPWERAMATLQSSNDGSDGASGGPIWDKLAAAFATLKLFKCGVPDTRFQEDPGLGVQAGVGDCQRFNKFISCILSSRALVQICLWFPKLDKHFEPADQTSNQLFTDAYYYPAYEAFQRAEWPNLKILRIQDMALQQTDLESLCGAAGTHNQRLETIYLDMVSLMDGTWARALDLLRQGTRPAHETDFANDFYGWTMKDLLDSGCDDDWEEYFRIRPDALSGGEFDDERFQYLKRNELLDRVAVYVSHGKIEGKFAGNPFRALD